MVDQNRKEEKLVVNVIRLQYGINMKNSMEK